MPGEPSGACPSDEELTKLALGQACGDPSKLEAHLAACAACLAVVGELGRNISQARTAGDGAFDDGAAPPTAERGAGATAIAPPSALSRLQRRAAESPLLARGQRVGRYEVLEPLGAGAMGVVYAARDPELDRAVALKLLRAELVPDARSRGDIAERMRREARAMAKLSHPEVIAVYDVGAHGDQLFLAMELVRGGTLRQWLAKRERSPGEVLDVVVRAGRGLAAAHAAGLVHRDFKPDNVLIGDDGGVHVTDFGLARWIAESEATAGDTAPPSSAGSAQLTRTGTVLGTPAYMAPEQLRGEVADARSDVFAFCVVLYEGIHGQSPFGGTTLATRRAAVLAGELRAPPPTPGVPRRVRLALARGLRGNPAARQASMEEVLAELAPPRTIGWRWLAGLGVVALAIASLAVVVALQKPHEPIVLEGAAPGLRPAFALLPVRGEPRWIGDAVAEAMRGSLSAGGGVRTLPNQTVAYAQRDLGLDLTGAPPTSDALTRVAAHVLADYLVEGSYEASGATEVRLRVRVVGASTGSELASVEERGSRQDLAELGARAGARLRRALDLAPASSAEIAAVRAELPSGEDGMEAYAAGLFAFHGNDFRAARAKLEQATTTAPGAPMPHAALGRTLLALGFDALARAEARRGFELAGELSQEDRLALEAELRRTEEAWDKAAGLYRALTTFFPDDLEYALQLLDAQIAAASLDDAEATLATIRRMPGPLGTAASVDQREITLAQARGDLPRLEAAAESALAKGRASGTDSVVTSALLARARARQRKGDGPGAEADLQECLRLAAATEDWSRVARTESLMAIQHAEHGETDEAEALFRRALAVHQEHGDEARASEVLVNLAILKRRAGKPLEARVLDEELLARDVGRGASKQRLAQDHMNLGVVLGELAELEPARLELEAARALWRDVGQTDKESDTLSALAALALERDDLRQARDLARGGLAIASAKASRADLSLRLARALAELDDRDGAKEAFEQACTALKELRNPAEAACRARYALALFRWGMKAEALAQADVADDLNTGRRAGFWEARLAFGFLHALLVPADRRSARLALASSMISGTYIPGQALQWFEVNLAVAQLDFADGNKAEAAKRLTLVVQEAEARAFLRVARQAKELMR